MLPLAVREGVGRLYEMSCLKSVSLHFDKSYPVFRSFLSPAREPKFALLHDQIFEHFFRPIIHRISGIQDLQIINLPCTLNYDIASRIGFPKLLANLQTLQLSISSAELDLTEERSWQNHSSRDFFATCPTRWLEPAKNLTCLVLSANFLWGFDPRIDFSATYFPVLQTLVLRNLVIFHFWFVEWLWNHADTLRHLYLDSSPLLVQPNGRDLDLLWNYYFDFLRTRLLQLRSFAIKHPKQGVDPVASEMSQPTSTFMIDQQWLGIGCTLSRTRYVSIEDNKFWWSYEPSWVNRLINRFIPPHNSHWMNQEWDRVTREDTQALEELQQAIQLRAAARKRSDV